MKRQIALAVAALFCAATSSFAMPQKAADITVSGYTGSNPLENFPVLVRIAEYDAESGKGIQGFSYADCAEGGADISFASAGGTILAHEIDTWDPTGESLVWVRVPSISGTTTFFSFRWNDANPPSVTASDVWGANYIGVWHFSEDGGTATDATGHGLSAVETGTSSLAPASKVGGARAVASGALQVADYESTYGGATVFSASGWFYCPGVTAGYRSVMNKKTTAGAAWNAASGWYLEMNNSLTQIGLIGCNNTKYTCNIPNITQGWNYFHIVSSGSNVKLYLNGGTSPAINKDHALKAAGVPLNLMPTVGYADEFRIRGVANGADWTRAEYQTVAVAGFLTYGAARLLAEDFLVTGTPEPIGSPSPAYGTHSGTSAGTSIPVKCPVWTNETGTAVYSCTGWKLYNGEGEVVDSGTENAFTYVHPTPAAYRRLEWQWMKSGKVPASTGGTVSGTLVYAPGDTVTLTATPAEGYTFFRWTGDIGNADPAEPTITFTATSADPVTALFGTQIVVAADGSGDYTSLNTAVSAASDNATILVRDGAYMNDTTAFLAISKPIKIVSENGADTTSFRGRATPSSSIIKTLTKGIQVNNALAIVKGITFYNFGCDGSQTPQGLGVYLQDGLVENCVISNTLPNHGASALHVTGGEARHMLIMKNTSRDGRNGAGVYMTGGTVTNCVIRNNSAPSGGGAYVDGANAKLLGCEIFSNSGTGGGVYLVNGLVSDCVITNNSGSAGGVRQTGGTLANCLVKGNKSSYAQSCGGVNSTGGTIRDCTILANTAYDATGRQLVKTAGELRGTTAGESLLAIPSSDLVSVADGVTVSDCVLQCPGIAGATLLNASQVFGGEAPRIVADKTVGLTNLVVAFSLDCADAASCAWSFGASVTPSSATGLAPTATFTEPGAYTVSATVTTSGGVTRELSLEIHALASDAYVSKTGSATFPYDTPEKATSDLTVAAAAVFADDAFVGTVHVAADTYTFDAASRTGTFAPWILVNKAVRVEGPGPDAATFDAAQKTMNLFLFHRRAIVSGLTFHRGKYSTNGTTYGGNLHMTAGIVTNCAFTSGYCPYGGQATMRGGAAYGCTFAGGSLSASGTDRHAGGLNVYAAVTVADCLIRNNSGCYGGGLHVNAANAVVTNCVIRNNSSSGCGGGGALVVAGLVTHCVITNNTSNHSGGVGINGASATLRNCVVAFNKATGTGSSYGAGHNQNGGGGIKVTSGGVVENCTVYGNTSASATRCDELCQSAGTVRNSIFLGTDATDSFDLYKTGGTATYCYFRPEVTGDGNVTGDAKIKGADTGDFTLLYGSVCLDAGMEIAAVATDILGVARPADGNDDGVAAWDIGAYEMNFAGQMAASFEADVTTGGAATEVTFTASVSGGTAPYTYTWTVGGVDYVTSEPTFTHTFGYGSHDVSLVIADATGAVSETVTRAGLVSIKTPVVYVSTTGTGVWPYDTWEKATDDWNAALTAVYATDEAPGTVLVADGTYTAHDSDVYTANLALPIVFMGTNTACGAIFNGQGRQHTVVNMNNAKAMLCNVTIRNCNGGVTGDGSLGSAIDIRDGVVSNCVFSGGTANGACQVKQYAGLLVDSTIKDHNGQGDAGQDRFAGGLYMMGGTAERLVISGNADGTAGGVRVNGANAVLRDSVIRNNTSSHGGAVMVDKGLVENCVISNNTNSAKTGNIISVIAGAGAYVTGTGTLRNCLVVGNRSTGGGAQPTAGALFVRSGSAYNNTAWANTLSTGATNDLYQMDGTAKNNIAGVFATAGGTADHNFSDGDPQFKNLAAGDWRLRGGSPCINVGDYTVWGATRAEAKACIDLAGSQRLVGPEVDIGCFEAQTSFTMLMLR